jgi:hypothetical protein
LDEPIHRPDSGTAGSAGVKYETEYSAAVDARFPMTVEKKEKRTKARKKKNLKKKKTQPQK